MKKKFERVFTLLLAALLVVSMAGCGGTPSEPPGEEGNDGGGETVVIRVNSAFNSATVDETANGHCRPGVCGSRSGANQRRV